MSIFVSDLIVQRDKTVELFNAKEFLDTAKIHRYFSSEVKEEEAVSKFDAISSIVDFITSLWFEAENEEIERGSALALNMRKDLPLSYERVNQLFEDSKNTDAPPLKLITQIAEQNYNIIKDLSDTLHRVLRRERSIVPIDKVQQLDTQCIRWLTRQPGKSTAQKAGEKQRLMSIVRYETLDTLENRVFKHFLKLCSINCAMYLREYKKKYPNHTRVKAVMRLYALSKQLLDSPEYKKIRKIQEKPVPNYTLQNNMKYARIWSLYCQLLNKTKVIESIWRNREIVLKELTIAAFIAYMHAKDSKNSKFNHYFWVLPYPDEQGHIFTNIYDRYLDYGENGTYLFQSDIDKMLYKNLNTDDSFNFKVAYIPSKIVPKYSKNDVYTKLIVFSEEKNEYRINLDENIIQNIYDQIGALK